MRRRRPRHQLALPLRDLVRTHVETSLNDADEVFIILSAPNLLGRYPRPWEQSRHLSHCPIRWRHFWCQASPPSLMRSYGSHAVRMVRKLP